MADEKNKESLEYSKEQLRIQREAAALIKETESRVRDIGKEIAKTQTELSSGIRDLNTAQKSYLSSWSEIQARINESVSPTAQLSKELEKQQKEEKLREASLEKQVNNLLKIREELDSINDVQKEYNLLQARSSFDKDFESLQARKKALEEQAKTITSISTSSSDYANELISVQAEEARILQRIADGYYDLSESEKERLTILEKSKASREKELDSLKKLEEKSETIISKEAARLIQLKQQNEALQKQLAAKKLLYESLGKIYEISKKVFSELVKYYSEYDNLVAKVAVSQGITRQQAVAQVDAANKVVNSMGKMTMTSAQFLEAVTAINNSFGVMAAEYMPEATAKVAELANAIGISKADSAKFFETLSQIGNTSFQSQQNMAGFAKAVSDASKVPLGTIINDVAKAGNNLRLIFRGNTEELIKQTAELRRLGSSLDSAAKSAESLLNFESSIGNELKLSALLGQSVNFNEARRLFFAGKIQEGEQAIIRELEKIGDLDKLNYFQRKALSDATGKDFETLQKMASQKQTLLEIESQNPKLAAERKKYEDELAKLQGNEIEKKKRANELTAMENVAKARSALLDEQKKQTMLAIGKAMEPIVTAWTWLQMAVLKFVQVLSENSILKWAVMTVGAITGIITTLGGAITTGYALFKAFMLYRTVTTTLAGVRAAMIGVEAATAATTAAQTTLQAVMTTGSAAGSIGKLGSTAAGNVDKVNSLGKSANVAGKGISSLATTMLASAAAFAIFAVGIIGIAYAFTLIKDVPIEQMGAFVVSIAALATVLAGLGGLVVLFPPLKIALLAVGAAMLVFGAGIALAGLGVKLFGDGVKSAAEGLDVIGKTIKNVGTTAFQSVAVSMAVLAVSLGTLSLAIFLFPVDKFKKIADSLKGLQEAASVLESLKGITIPKLKVEVEGLTDDLIKKLKDLGESGNSLMLLKNALDGISGVSFANLVNLGTLSTSISNLISSLAQVKDTLLSISAMSSNIDIFKSVIGTLPTEINKLVDSLKLVSKIPEIKFPVIVFSDEEKVKSIILLGEKLNSTYLILQNLSNIKMPSIEVKIEGITDDLTNKLETFSKSLGRVSSSIMAFGIVMANPIAVAGLGILNLMMLGISNSIKTFGEGIEKITSSIKNLDLTNIITSFKNLANVKIPTFEINIKGLGDNLLTKLENLFKNLSNIPVPKFDFDIKGFTTELSNNIKNIKDNLSDLSKIKLVSVEISVKGLTDDLIKKFKYFRDTSSNLNLFANALKSISNITIPSFEINISGLTDDLLLKIKNFNNAILNISSEAVETSVGKINTFLNTIRNIISTTIPPFNISITGINESIVSIDQISTSIQKVGNVLKSVSNIVTSPIQFNIKGLDNDLIDKLNILTSASDKINLLSNSIKNLSSTTIPKIDLSISGLTDDLINKIKSFTSSKNDIELITSSLSSLSKISIPPFEFNIKGFNTEFTAKIDETVAGINLIAGSIKSLSSELLTFPIVQLREMFDKIVLFGQSGVNIKNSTDILKELSSLDLSKVNIEVKGVDTLLISQFMTLEESSETIKTNMATLKELSSIEFPKLDIDTESVEALAKSTEVREKQTAELKDGLNLIAKKLDTLTELMSNGGIAVNLDAAKVSHVLNTAKIVRGTYGQVTSG